jgi:hypothetical protein
MPRADLLGTAFRDHVTRQASFRAMKHTGVVIPAASAAVNAPDLTPRLATI